MSITRYGSTRIIFFVMKFNRPVVDSLYLPMGETEKRKTQSLPLFDMQPGDELMMKVALSTTSIDGAKKESGSRNSCLGF